VKRVARPITAKYLQNAATFYLERYASTAEGLRRVLNRRVSRARMLEAPVMENVKQAIDAIVAKFVDAGVIDDKAFAQTKARSLHRRGTSSRVTRQKLKMAGVDGDTLDEAIEWGVTGPGLRACGFEWDFRKKRPYSGYEQFEFDIPTGSRGDCYDRGLVRVEEIRQSLRIIEQCLKHMPDGPYKSGHRLATPPLKEHTMHDIETLITHFLNVSWGPVIPPGEVFMGVEATKGNNGYYLISDGSSTSYRTRIRTPSFAHLQMLPLISRGLTVQDLLAIIASVAQILWVKLRGHKVETMLWVSLGIIVVFGGATLWLQDESFIKWKPTVLYWVFASAIFGAALFGRNLIRGLMNAQLELPEAAWSRLNLSWGAFFAVMGLVNLWVAFTYSTDAWVNFKLFGSMGLMLVFVIAQGMMLSKYMDKEENQ